VAHDLRTPLSRLRASAEQALQSAPDVSVYKEALADSLEESDRVLTMLNTLMDISEAESGLMKLSLTSVNLDQLAREVVELYDVVADEKRVVIDLNIPDRLECLADRNRLRQVFGNLLDNALKYTNPGGRVEILARSHGSNAEIEFKDNGIGIPSGDIPRIWERLYRGDRSRSQRGLGLGLSLVKAVISAHRGTIDVISEVNKGTTFVVKLPMAPTKTLSEQDR